MEITIQGEYWGTDCPPEERSKEFVGLVVACFLDTEGVPWFAFEMPDQLGVQVIGADSRFLLSTKGSL